MKAYQKITYLLSAVAALFLPLSVMAFDLSSITSKDLFVAPAGDKSIGYLSQLFGSVGGVLQGTSGQLLGELLGVLNYGVVIIASCIMVYTVLLSVINTAQDGEFMGRSMKSAWIVVRSVMGMGLLVPQATGYSLAQVVVMWAVVQGVGFADKAWEKSLNYLVDSGGVYSQMATVAPTYDPKSTTNTLLTANKMLQSAVCAYKLEDTFQQAYKKKQAEYRANPTPELKEVLAKSLPQFGYFINPDAKTISFGFKTWNAQLNPYNQSICGTYSWGLALNSGVKGFTEKVDSTQPTEDPKKLTETGNRFDGYVRTGVEQMAGDIVPLAKRIAKREYKDLSTPDNVADATDNLVIATLDYENLTTATVGMKQTDAAKKRAEDIQSARDSGWITAGAYYHTISSWGLAATGNKDQPATVVENQLKTIAADDLVKKVFQQIEITQVDSPEKLKDMAQSLLQSLKQTTDFIDKEYVGKPELPSAHAKLVEIGAKGIGSITKGNNATNDDRLKQNTGKAVSLIGWDINKLDVVAAASWAGGPVFGAINTVLLTELKKLTNDWADTMNNTQMDGIAKAQILGQNMIERAGKIWIGTAIIGGAIGTVASLLATALIPTGFLAPSAAVAVQTILHAANAQVGHAMPLVSTVCLALMANGMVLSAYVPLIPFFVFAFAVIGWFVAVLEAMVAAPLVALGITHPEGHDLMGKAEQATMLLLSVFLRPVLMIIGLMAGILLSWIAIKVVNLGFGYAVDATLGDGLFGPIFRSLALMVVYTVILITVLGTSFSLIHVIPQKVMNWVGLHPEAGGVEGMMHEAKGGIHGSGQTGGQFGNAGVEGSSKEGMISGLANNALKKHSEKKPPEANTTVKPVNDDKK